MEESKREIERESKTESESKSEKFNIKKSKWGRISNEDIYIYKISSPNISIKVSNYGSIISNLSTKNRSGELENIVLGYKDLESYINNSPYLGAIIGRVSNRIGGGRCNINGEEYKLSQNMGNNHLHGGFKGFDKVIWRISQEPNINYEADMDLHSCSITFTYTSPDMEENYPGELEVYVTYIITHHPPALSIKYSAITHSPTIVNMTNHSYFNLSGDIQSGMDTHYIRILADYYTVLGEDLVPTGEIRSLDTNPYDLRQMKNIQVGLQEVGGMGYDINYVVREGGKQKVAEVREETSGRWMEVVTTEPGIQFYTGNFLDPTLKGVDKHGGELLFYKHSAFCLECQQFPDAINHPEFKSIILNPGEEYTQFTTYSFGIYDK